jgi:outer membrane protein assembly factor BamB
MVFAQVLDEEGRSAVLRVGEDGRECWRALGNTTCVLMRDTQVVTVLERPDGKSLVRLDLRSGSELERQDCEFSMDAVLDDGSGFIGTNVRELRPTRVDLARVDLTPEVRVRWKTHSQEGEGTGRFSFALCVAAGRVLASRESSFEALDVHTGGVLWALRSNSPGCHRWNPIATNRHVVVTTSRGTEVLELDTGRRCWGTAVSGPRCVGDGRVLILSAEGRLLEFDLSTGAVCRETDLRASTRRAFSIEPVFVTDVAASRTHVYVGDVDGRLWGFARATGAAVWSDKPVASGGFGGEPVIAEGALYVSRGDWTATEDPSLYCYRAG